MTRSTPLDDALVDRLSTYERVVEVGIGRRTAVAASLADRGVAVTATDVHARSVPDPVDFVRDDVLAPAPTVYDGADAIYALNLPPELHRPVAEVATDVGADFLFTTLGGDQPQLPVARESLPVGALFVASLSGPGDG
ncbi:hypothetical protein Halru_0330 [Halovivax ruber XH-70]|uniref:UPF0146 protein Halru_0330 n=1 Tax=Halovivax ruber (strain DSM 18193 / JCM 13892 / XH-70) TaxID=797302 RepID=L0I8E8_HALRX|nr:UPF0146 family protein [Halovivax ruber]AGB14974.1 hypothetical protein Halru_0330 [Halovivax ruber XH-70]